MFDDQRHTAAEAEAIDIALKLSAKSRISEMFDREEYVLAKLLHPHFKGKLKSYFHKLQILIIARVLLYIKS